MSYLWGLEFLDSTGHLIANWRDGIVFSEKEYDLAVGHGAELLKRGVQFRGVQARGFYVIRVNEDVYRAVGVATKPPPAGVRSGVKSEDLLRDRVGRELMRDGDPRVTTEYAAEHVTAPKPDLSPKAILAEQIEALRARAREVSLKTHEAGTEWAHLQRNLAMAIAALVAQWEQTK